MTKPFFRLFAAHPARLDAATPARAVALLSLSDIESSAIAAALNACAAEVPNPLAAAARASAAASACG